VFKLKFGMAPLQYRKHFEMNNKGKASLSLS